MTENAKTKPILAIGSYLENLYYTALTFNIVNVILSICILPIHVSPIILVSTIAIIPLFVIFIQSLNSGEAHKDEDQKNWLEKAGDYLVEKYNKSVAIHWLPKLIWDIVLAFGVTSSLYSLFTYFDISLGLNHMALITQLSIVGGALFFLTQVANYFIKNLKDPETQRVSRFIEITNSALIFALTSIVTIGSLYAEVTIYGANVVLLTLFVAIIFTISILYTLARSEEDISYSYVEKNSDDNKASEASSELSNHSILSLTQEVERADNLLSTQNNIPSPRFPEQEPGFVDVSLSDSDDEMNDASLLPHPS